MYLIDGEILFEILLLIRTKGLTRWIVLAKIKCDLMLVIIKMIRKGFVSRQKKLKSAQ